MLIVSQKGMGFGREQQQFVRKVKTFHIVIKTFVDVGNDFQLLTTLSTSVDKVVNKMVQFNILVLLQKRRFELNWLQVDMVLFIRMSLYSSKISSNDVSVVLPYSSTSCGQLPSFLFEYQSFNFKLGKAKKICAYQPCIFS